MFPVETAANAKNAPVILFFIMFIFTFIIKVFFKNNRWAIIIGLKGTLNGFLGLFKKLF